MPLFPPGMFKQKRVLITGAGRGIGAAIAQYLVDDGAQVFAHLGREPGNPNWVFPQADAGSVAVDLQGEVSKTMGNKACYTCTSDLAQAGSAEQVVAHAGATLGAIDILINNAGTMLGRVSMSEMSLAHYHAVTDLNSRSVVLMTAAALPFLKQAGNASIVNVTSISMQYRPVRSIQIFISATHQRKS